jgi:WD40 repeat protein
VSVTPVVDRVQITGQFTQNYLGSDACWFNDNLLVCSTNGSVYLYNVKPSQDYAKKDLGSKVTEYKLNKPKVRLNNNCLICTKFTQNTVNKSPLRINKVCINPVQPNMFMTLQNQLVTIWDIQNVNDPLTVKRVSKSFPLAADWSHTGNKFAVGGMGKSIKLFDTRMFSTVEQNPVVWEQSDAHKDEVRGKLQYFICKFNN